MSKSLKPPAPRSRSIAPSSASVHPKPKRKTLLHVLTGHRATMPPPRAEKRHSKPPPEQKGGLWPRAGIELRRYGGPSAYVGPLTHVRIAHLTDIHVGIITPMRVQRKAVEMTNAQKPDLVVITGDFVCHSQLYLDQLHEIIRSFSAPVMGVLGNHDHWSGSQEVRTTLRRAGAEVLDNAHTTITLRNQRLQVLGLDDAYTGHAQRDKALKGLRKDLPTLGLSHIAEEADALWKHDIPLVLSGHTHAGQITIARLHELAIGKLAGHKYIHGLYGTRSGELGKTGAVYVGAGIGSSVVPFRFGERARREIAIFELGVPPASIEEHHREQSAHPGRKPSARVQARRAHAVQEKLRLRELREIGKR